MPSPPTRRQLMILRVLAEGGRLQSFFVANTLLYDLVGGARPERVAESEIDTMQRLGLLTAELRPVAAAEDGRDGD